MKDRIEELIKSQLKVSAIEIVDFSAQHEGHKGNEGGGHFQAVIISDDFKELSLLDTEPPKIEIVSSQIKNKQGRYSRRSFI